MEKFLKPFLKKGIVSSSGKLQVNADGLLEYNDKLLKKLIFKPEVLIEFKQLLKAACSPEPFAVKSDTIKKLIKCLSKLVSSDEDIQIKADIFCCLFQAFAGCCKEDEGVPVIEFFIVLSHILGVNEATNAADAKQADKCSILVNSENFKNALSVDPHVTSTESFFIFKQLLFNLTKTSVSLNSTEFQSHNKWLQSVLKGLANHQAFQSILLDVFLVAAEIDIKFLEGNLEYIFNSILSQNLPVEKNFSDSYGIFLENALHVCAKFQRTTKFITKFLSSLKVIPTLLDKEIILPLNVVNEFSKTVALASNQQSFLLLDILVQNIDECFINLSQNNSESTLLLFVTSELLIGFFKEVKLFAPSIAVTTLQSFIAKLGFFKKSLQDFGHYLFSSKSFIVKNEDIVRVFLELCFYCGEIQLLINCYKESVLQPSDVTESCADCDWQCCLTLDQWDKMINLVLKLKLRTCDTICFHLAQHKLRSCKLENNISNPNGSTLKIMMHQLTADLNEFNIIQQVSPEDFTILLDFLTVEQSKSVTKNILKQLLENDNKVEIVAWLSNSALQENLFFIISMFADLIKEAQSILLDVVSEKSQLKASWLSEEYFDCQNCVCLESLERLSEKINALLKNFKKIRQSLRINFNRKDDLVKIVEIFKLLPLTHMKDDFRRLGLSFAVAVGTFLSCDESSVHLVFESICRFIAAETDASTCFDMGLCIKWLSEVSYESRVNDLKVKVIESLVRSSPGTKLGLSQMGKMIESTENSKLETSLKMLETRVVLYNELGKCWQRAKKRKADNDLIGSYRAKLAKIISEEVKDIQDDINPENSKLLLKIFGIELNKATKTNEESEIVALMERKFPSYFEFAVKNMEKMFDESSATFLTVVLQSMTRVEKFLPKDTFLTIWKALRGYENVNWRLFCEKSSDEEFTKILNDLLNMSKTFLDSLLDKHSSNCFEIWKSFFESSPKSKRNCCQLELQKFFSYIHNCHLFLKELPIKNKINLIRFFTFCLTNKEVVMTSYVLDTIIDVILEYLDESASIEDFHDLFIAEVEASCAILSKQFAWSKCKVHLTFVIFKRLLAALMKRCNAGQETDKDDVIKLSLCAFNLEKWASQIIKKEKDFARISAYFVTALISSITSYTVVPAVKFHLINCINHFLSISDSHTVAYLMRVLKPGYQQVFNMTYNQFQKYHKYSGKI